MQYTVVIERTSNGWGAYVPDLPGCVAVADTRKDVQHLIEEAITLHITRMRKKGETVPRPSAYVIGVDVPKTPSPARKKA